MEGFTKGQVITNCVQQIETPTKSLLDLKSGNQAGIDRLRYVGLHERPIYQKVFTANKNTHKILTGSKE